MMPAAFHLPPIFLLPTHMDAARLRELANITPSMTDNIHEADIIVGNISKKGRALFELRHRQLQTDPVEAAGAADLPQNSQKRRRNSATAGSELTALLADINDPGIELFGGPGSACYRSRPGPVQIVRVVKLAWLTDSQKAGQALPLNNYILYEGRKRAAPLSYNAGTDRNILRRPLASITTLEGDSPSAFHQTVPSLIRQTTSEHNLTSKLPSVPSSLKTTYSCQRKTPANPPNASFAGELTKIRTKRRLVGDQIGVRAYSTLIATILAYPFAIVSPQEITRLPGCGSKVAELWHEWKESGRLREVDEAHGDPKLSVLQAFYDIWGVGDATARDFYNKGWRDLDDVVDFGWQSLSRAQQIGVKFYDEFKLKIQRDEVEAIAEDILKHARNFSPDFQMVIVGGYRRGKQDSGDVDVIISHPDESATLNFVDKLVLSLEKSRRVTHTLSLSTHNSQRGQRPVSWRGNERRGSGFDTLDKALVVWQEPLRDADDRISLEKGRACQAPHRRVDIIVSPWKTVGCALLGWSGETTFQRDLRRYCKKERGLRFDSSGIRSRLDGTWVNFEGGDGGTAQDMLTAEKRVFDGLGLRFVDPYNRCTG